MPDATLVKDINHSVAALHIIDCRGAFLYPTEFLGASSGFGTSSNQIAIHLSGSPSLTDADQELSDIQIPTCTSSLLDITVNVGAHVVTDVTSITADPSDQKLVLMSAVIDDTSGAIEILAFEKTTGEYGAMPAGKTLCGDLKEYSVPAAGTVLTEINNFI